MMAPRKVLGTLMMTVVAAFTVASAPAAAQWIWKDEAGHVMASDQPPPVGTPDARIMKKPRTNPTPATVTPDAAKLAAQSPTQSVTTKSLAERELEAKQKQKEADDAAKKTADEAARASAMKQNCSSARGNLAALQSGGRAARFNEKGEKVFISDADRQGEISKQQAQVSQYCNG